MSGASAERGMFRNPPVSLSGKLGSRAAPDLLHICGRQHAAMAGQSHGGRNRQRRMRRGTARRARNISRRMLGAIKQGSTLAGVDEGRSRQRSGRDRRDAPGHDAYEKSYGLNFPVNAYPLFENAIRGCRGRDVAAHLNALGQFFSPFSKVASENPYSWFPTFRSPEEISTPSGEEPLRGFSLYEISERRDRSRSWRRPW